MFPFGVGGFERKLGKRSIGFPWAESQKFGIFEEMRSETRMLIPRKFKAYVFGGGSTHSDDLESKSARERERERVIGGERERGREREIEWERERVSERERKRERERER